MDRQHMRVVSLGVVLLPLLLILRGCHNPGKFDELYVNSTPQIPSPMPRTEARFGSLRMFQRVWGYCEKVLTKQEKKFGHIKANDHFKLSELSESEQDAYNKTELWLRKNSSTGDYQRVTKQTVNLHDINKYVVDPFTDGHNASFVEMVTPPADAARENKMEFDGTSEYGFQHWFVSHVWSMPFFDHIKLLERHAELHGLIPEKAYYWICAFANKQHNLACEITPNPEESSFVRAMGRAEQVVSLGVEAYFEKMWTWYEMAVSQAKKFRHEYFAFVQPQSEDGCASSTSGLDVLSPNSNPIRPRAGKVAELKDAGGKGRKVFSSILSTGTSRVPVQAKLDTIRQKYLEIIRATCLSVAEAKHMLLTFFRNLEKRFEESNTSKPSDKINIMNSVTGYTGLEKDNQLPSHPRLDEINSGIHGAMLNMVLVTLTHSVSEKCVCSEGTSAYATSDSLPARSERSIAAAKQLMKEFFFPQLLRTKVYSLTIRIQGGLAPLWSLDPSTDERQVHEQAGEIFSSLWHYLPATLSELNVEIQIPAPANRTLLQQTMDNLTKALFDIAATARSGRKRLDGVSLWPINKIIVNGEELYQKANPGVMYPARAGPKSRAELLHSNDEGSGSVTAMLSALLTG